MTSYDFAIVGAGMAGASLAAGLAGQARVVLLEAESQPGYHATGRSAAFWTESYGGPQILPLTAASRPFLAEHGMLTPRGALTIARDDEQARLDAFAAEFAALGVAVQHLDRAQLSEQLPGLRDQWRHGVLEPDCCDIDVAALHQLYLATARRGGADLLVNARLTAADRAGDQWTLACADARQVRAKVLINAAGAWADPVAAIAGARPLGIKPYRRTIAQLRMVREVPLDLHLTLALDGSFYFRPDAGRLWLSPHDETPSQPCDAAPEEIDVATAIDRFEQAVDWPIAAVERKWAGLRSFAPDRLPVYGFDPRVPGLFWFAGQGGFGIQTAPAAADLAIRLLLGQPPGEVDPARYAADRFA